MGDEPEQDYSDTGLMRASEMRAQVRTAVAYRLPLLALLGSSFAFFGFWSCLLLAVGAFTLLSDLFDLFGWALRIGGLVGAYLLGIPWWLIVAIVCVTTIWRGISTRLSYLVANWFPSPPGTYVWQARCAHLADSGKAIQSMVRLGRWSDALDASLQALADHPRERGDCLAELALMTAEIAVEAGAPEIAVEVARAAPRLTESQSRTHRAVDVRSFTANARAEADQGNFERAWAAIDRAGENTGDARKLVGPVKAVAAGIAALTKRSSADADKLVGVVASNLGVLSEATDVTLLEFADWFRISGRPREALDLYHLARTATEFDRFIQDINGVPRALNRRWSLRGRRWARAVHGQLLARLDLAETPSKSMIAAAGAAATVLTNLGEVPALVSLSASIAAAQTRAGSDPVEAAETVDSTATRHRYVVLDHQATRRWELAAESTRPFLVQTGPTQPVPAEATWLAGTGTDIARSGLTLSRGIDDVVADRLVTSLRTLARRLGEVGFKDEALAAAEEVVDIRRQTDGAGTNPTWHLGYPLWRLGVCLEEVGRKDDGIAVHLESLQYFRLGAAQNESDRLTCAQAVRDSVARLVDAERYTEALALALEAVRRFSELRSDAPSDDLDRATEALALVYHRLERFSEAAETRVKLAEAWERSTANPTIAHAAAAESYWRASQSWRSAEHLDDEFTCLRQAYENLCLVEDPAYSREWQMQRRRTVGRSFGSALMDRGRPSEAIAPLRDALASLRRLAENDVDLNESLRAMIAKLARCLGEAAGDDGSEILGLRAEALEISLGLPHDDVDRISSVVDSAYWLAMTHFRAGRLSEAEHAIDRGMSALPGGINEALWLRYAGYLASTSLGNVQDAAAHLSAAISSASDDSDADPRALDVMTRCVFFVAAGDRARALEYIAAATSNGELPGGQTRRLLWDDLGDLESVIGADPAIDEIRVLVPRVEHA